MKPLTLITTVLQSPYTFWLLLALPALPLLADIGVRERYYPEIMYESGLLSVQFLVLALLITPLMQILRPFKTVLAVLRWLQRRRRAIGVASFGYAVLHAFFYIRETGSLDEVLLEVLDMDLALGWVAMLLMTLLAATSNSWSVRLLGKKWRTIQRMAYFAAALTALHWIWIDQFLDDLWIWALPVIVFQIVRIGRNTFQKNAFAKSAINGE